MQVSAYIWGDAWGGGEILWPQGFVTIPVDESINGAQVHIGHHSSLSGQLLWPLYGATSSEDLFYTLAYKRWKGF